MKLLNSLKKSDQKGLTMIEQVITLMLVGLVIVVWFDVFKVTNRGQVRSKFNLRAQNIASSHLEEMKNNARNLALASQWQFVTQSAMAVAYQTPTTVTVEARNLTWTVTTSFMSVTTVGNAAASSVTYTTNMVRFVAQVDWLETNSPKSLTLTGFISNERD